MNLEAIQRKTEDLSRVLESAAVAARRTRDRRLSAVLGIFTAVSVVASIIAVLVFVFAETVFGEGAVVLRWFIVTMISLVAVSGLVLVNRSSARPAGRKILDRITG